MLCLFRTLKLAENIESVGVIATAINVGGFVCGGNEDLNGDMSDKLSRIRFVCFIQHPEFGEVGFVGTWSPSRP